MLPLVAGALVIGLIVGFLGSGGSVLTVPILVYVAGHNPKPAIAESMAIVGIVALAAAVPYTAKRLVDWHSVVWFGIPGVIGTWVGAWLGGLSSDALQLLVFGGMLLLASAIMFHQLRTNHVVPPEFMVGEAEPATANEARPRNHYWQRIGEGLVVGVLTGFVGVGGGFMMVPALVILGKLPMRLAIGTSLVIIVLKSAIGFFKYQQQLAASGSGADLATIAIFAAIGIVGSLIGQQVNARLNQRRLQAVFTLFLVAIGIFVLWREGTGLIAGGTHPASTSQRTTLETHES
jgi:hypothetical protein